MMDEGKLVRLTDSGQAVRNRAIQDIAPDMANIIPQFGLEDVQATLPFYVN